MTKIIDITKRVYSGGTPDTRKSEYWNGNIKWLSSGETRNNFVYDTDKKITELGVLNSSTKLANKNSIVMACAGQGFTRGQTSYLMDDMYINQSVICIEPDEEKVDGLFLYYYFKNSYQMLRNLSDDHSSRGSITTVMIKNLEVDFPNLTNQKKISTILYSLDKKIELNNKINNYLQELINNIFISKFVNFDEYTGEYKTTEIGDIPINWRIDNFGSVISFSNGYGWDSKDMLENSKPDTYKVFKMGNIKIGGGINKEKTKSWILKEKCSGLEQFLSKKGDVLMCMTDMKSSENPLLGHTALIDRDDEFVINQRVGLIRCDKEIKWPYIYTMTNLPFFISDIRSKAHSGVQVNLTTSGICDTKVLIPDEETLNEFYKNVTPMYEKMFVLNNEIEYLEQLRDTLLPRLMNGEIDLENIEI